MIGCAAGFVYAVAVVLAFREILRPAARSESRVVVAVILLILLAILCGGAMSGAIE